MPRTTLEDVAKEAGVSFKTVSRVINDEPNVSKATTAKVRAAIATLNYVPNSAARRLSSGKALAFGLVVGWAVTSPYSSTLIEQTLQACTRRNHGLALFSMEDGVTQKIVEAYRGRQVDGMILDTKAAKDEALMAQLAALGVPHIVIHPDNKKDPTRTSYIQIDNQSSAREAVNYLIGIGHRSIGCIAFGPDWRQHVDRVNGYTEALRAAGLPILPAWITADILPYQVGFNSTLQYFNAHRHVTALFTETDEIAMGALTAIWKMGLKVPDDVSVVGFDDIPYASMITPPLTTIHQPIDEIAAIAVDHLIASVEDPSLAPIDLSLPTRLVIRHSCKAPVLAHSLPVP